jgi:orotidine-5'-phosphate decarboxylase
MWKRNTGICFAADLDSLTEVENILNKISIDIDNIKVNYPLILREGLEVITKLKDKYELPVIADLKVADVEVTNNRIISYAGKAGADAIFVHGFIGSYALQQANEEAEKWGMGIVIVTQLTNQGGEEFGQVFAEDFAELANQMNLFGIQAPGTRPSLVSKMRKVVGPNIKIFSCGIGAQGGEVGTAIRCGADFEIIGRMIYKDENPALATRTAALTLRSNFYQQEVRDMR